MAESETPEMTMGFLKLGLVLGKVLDLTLDALSTAKSKNTHMKFFKIAVDNSWRNGKNKLCC